MYDLYISFLHVNLFMPLQFEVSRLVQASNAMQTVHMKRIYEAQTILEIQLLVLINSIYLSYQQLPETLIIAPNFERTSRLNISLQSMSKRSW